MKTLLLIVVCALLAGCGDANYVEEPVKTKTVVFPVYTSSH
jgi:outer membrane biogenesis lipoprotein LolB